MVLRLTRKPGNIAPPTRLLHDQSQLIDGDDTADEADRPALAVADHDADLRNGDARRRWQQGRTAGNGDAGGGISTHHDGILSDRLHDHVRRYERIALPMRRYRGVGGRAPEEARPDRVVWVTLGRIRPDVRAEG